MELQDYLKVLAKHIYLVVISVIILVGFAIYDYNKSPISYSGSITFTGGNKSAATGEAYNYDRYYNLAATGILTDTVSGWVASPNILQLIHDKAGVGMPGGKIVSLARVLRTTKSSPESSVVVVTYSNQDSGQVEKILAATGSVISDQVSSLQSTGAFPSELTITPSSPTVISDKKDLSINLVLAVIAGLILGTILAFSREAFKRV